MSTDQTEQPHSKHNYARMLCLASGMGLIATSLLFNEYLVGIFDPTPPVHENTVHAIRTSQTFLFGFGVVFLFASEALRRFSFMRDIMNKPLIINIVFLCLTLVLPISLLEATLRPFAQLNFKTTTIFEKDPDLGWKLKPQANDIWCGKKVSINAKGVRGPELPYERAPSAKRILYLGDSVTFGCRLASYQHTFPYLIESLLEQQGQLQVETVNAGVGGYSPWQEYIYLVKEGIKYQPDLIILSFVLNDVTEKFRLTKFGGHVEGWQLYKSANSFFDRIYKSNSGIMYFARRFAEWQRFGTDTQKGAIQVENFNIRYLIENPDDPQIKNAWKMTLANLDKIATFSREQGIPLIIVLFPFSFQLDSLDLENSPHTILSQFTTKQAIPYINLLPIFKRRLQEHKWTPHTLFADMSHPSEKGAHEAAVIISDFIDRQTLLHDK